LTKRQPGIAAHLKRYLTRLKTLVAPAASSRRKAIDPRRPVAAQLKVTSKTRRKILRRLAAERRQDTQYLRKRSRQIATAFRLGRRLARAFSDARSKRVAVGSIVTRRLESRSKGRRVIKTAKFKLLRHGRLKAA